MKLNETELYILFQLVNKNSFCKNHISETDLKKAVPQKQAGKKFKKAIKNLRNSGYLNPVRKEEIEYCLVPSKIQEVKKILSKYFSLHK